LKPIIETLDLTKRFGRVTAVDHLSFQVEQGEIFGLLGPNGAGKTTTIRLLTGLLRPTSGTARVAGYSIHGQLRQVKQRVGVLQEISNLWEEMTVRGNLLFLARLYGVPRRERGRRVDQLISTFGLEDWQDTTFRALSRGLRRRTALAATLIHNPPILILDEPTTGLDVQSRRHLHQLIRQLREEGKTILLTTHYIEEAEELCDQLLLLHKGRRVAMGSPSALRHLAAGQPATVTLTLTFDNISPGLTNRIASLPSVVEIHPTGGQDARSQTITLTTSNPSSLLPHLLRLVAAEGLTLRFLSIREPTLEEAFLKLTGLPPDELRREKH